MDSTIFAIVEGEDNPKNHDGTFRYHGYEDTVFNHNFLISDIKRENYTTSEIERRKDPSIMAKRFFTVLVVFPIESLTLTMADFDEMKGSFPTVK
jgi:hypothetical protein